MCCSRGATNRSNSLRAGSEIEVDPLGDRAPSAPPSILPGLPFDLVSPRVQLAAQHDPWLARDESDAVERDAIVEVPRDGVDERDLLEVGGEGAVVLRPRELDRERERLGCSTGDRTSLPDAKDGPLDAVGLLIRRVSCGGLDLRFLSSSDASPVAGCSRIPWRLH